MSARAEGGALTLSDRWRGWMIFGVALASAMACVPPRGGWDLDALAKRESSVLAQPDQRLADSPPYFAPDADGLLLFLCRWPSPARLRVSLPADATDAERGVLEAALSAWQGAGLGLHFVETPHSEAQIKIDFADVGPSQTETGDALADCSVPADFGREFSHAPIAAQLVRASVRLQRSRLDALGRVVRLTSSELAGAALHELGHALGFSGHAARGNSVMVREVQVVHSWGQRVLEGAAFRDPSLEVLYQLPAGTVVGHLPVSADLRSELQALGRRAAAAGWADPIVQVGEGAARMFWRVGSRTAADFQVADWLAVLRRPDRLAAEAEIRIAAGGRSSKAGPR